MLDRIKTGWHLILSLPPAFACGKTHLPRQREEKLHPTFGFITAGACVHIGLVYGGSKPRPTVCAYFSIFLHSRNVCPCRTVHGRARSPAPTAVWIYFHHSRDVYLCRAVYGRRGSPPLRGLASDFVSPSGFCLRQNPPPSSEGGTVTSDLSCAARQKFAETKVGAGLRARPRAAGLPSCFRLSRY